ncbi:MAG: acyl-CoA dehydrogenase family protein [Pseudomonadaceae bacterium]|nr:acyl-CoA dehydrogenase family protein [Pseudomonadaceae bacterium]
MNASTTPSTGANFNPCAVVETFGERIRKGSDAMERERQMSASLAADMAKSGLFRMLVPTEYGGFESHPGDYYDALARCARHDGAVAWVLMIGTTTSTMAAGMSDEWAQRVYAEAPDVITCGVTAPMGRATPVEGGYRVSGKWPFGSASGVSQWIAGGSIVEGDETGRPHLMLFDASDVTIHDTWHTSGLCGTGSHHFEANDVFVPEGRYSVMGEPGRIDSPLFRFPTLGLLALGVSAVSIGIAQRAIDAFIELAGGKTPTGSAKPLAMRSSAQAVLAQAIADVESAKALAHQSIDRAWQAAEASERLSREDRAALRLAASNGTWRAAGAVDALYHAAGGSAIYLNSDLQRCFRDVHISTQHIMVAKPTLDVIGRVHLGLDPKSML